MRIRRMLALALLGVLPVLAGAAKPKVGEQPPEVALSKVLNAEQFAQEGKPLNLAGLRGHLILIEFWATW